jgi:sensor histidine kinase YesM
VRAELSDASRAALVPPFALQTLVENAVRHAAAPRVEPTTVVVTAEVGAGMLTVTVRDDGAGTDPQTLSAAAGTGLSRLRERLAALYSDRARLRITTRPGAGFMVELAVPAAADDVHARVQP